MVLPGFDVSGSARTRLALPPSVTWYVTAVFTGPDEQPWVAGQPDYEAGGWGAEAQYTRPKFAEARLSPVWFALPLGLVGLGIAVLVAVGVRNVRRSRRAVAAYAAGR